MRELPRQLSVEELAELFEGRTRLVELLATREDPLGSADDAIAELDEAEKLEALNAHPAIGARSGLSERSAAEQGADADPVILTELAYLNQVYEEKFGFRFVVFVDRRPKTEILEVLRSRLERTPRGGARDRAARAGRDRAGPLGELGLVDPYANEWLSFLARWLHVMAGIVWIGTSFYFVALDNHLRENESWEVHGGGFYRVREVHARPAAAARRPALVQVGGVHDLALGLRAASSSSTTSTPPRISSSLAGRSAPAGRSPSASCCSAWRGSSTTSSAGC